MGVDGLVGVRGEGGTEESEGVVDMRFDSVVPAFSSTLWAMDAQLEERSVLTVCREIVVATERVEGGRDPNGGTRACDLVRTEGGGGMWWLSCFFSESTGESQHRVASVISDPALDSLWGCEKEGCRAADCVSVGEGSDVDLERRRRKCLMTPPRRRASMAARAKPTGGTGWVVRSTSTSCGTTHRRRRGRPCCPHRGLDCPSWATGLSGVFGASRARRRHGGEERGCT